MIAAITAVFPAHQPALSCSSPTYYQCTCQISKASSAWHWSHTLCIYRSAALRHVLTLL